MGTTVAQLILHYTDGTSEAFDLRNGYELDEWWLGASRLIPRDWHGENTLGQFFYRSGEWHPDMIAFAPSISKAIAETEFKKVDAYVNSVEAPILVAITFETLFVPAAIDIDPDTLNLKSKGKWITAYIELPEGYKVSDINVSTMLLNDTISAESLPTEIGDYDSDNIPDLMVKIDRTSVEDLIDVPSEIVELTLTGTVAGMPFEGTDTIRVI